jgi:hypothetical protein
MVPISFVPFSLAILGNICSVGGDEQEEIAISPLIWNIFVVLLLEHIPYMYMHLSTMLECKKCNWFLSESNMSCSLFNVDNSEEQQMTIFS